MSEMNIPFKKGFFGFKPEKVMEYVDELLKNSDFDQIRISELEKRISSFDRQLAERDAIIASKKERIAELEAEIEQAKANVEVGVKCAECDVQKKAESLLGETLFDVKRFSLYLVNDAKQKAHTTISDAKGTADAVSSRAKEILYNVDDISSNFTSQIEELRSSLSGLSVRLDAFCTGINNSVDKSTDEDKVSYKNKPINKDDKIITDIKSEIYSELPPDVIDGINSLNNADNKLNTEILNNNKSSECEITSLPFSQEIAEEVSTDIRESETVFPENESDTDNGCMDNDIVSFDEESQSLSKISDSQVSDEFYNKETVFTDENIQSSEFINTDIPEQSVETDAAKEESMVLSDDMTENYASESNKSAFDLNFNIGYESEQKKTSEKLNNSKDFIANTEALSENVQSDPYDTDEENAPEELNSFIPEPFSLNTDNKSFSTMPENQIPVNVVRNGETVMPGMVSPFADLFGDEYKVDSPSAFSDFVPSADAPAFMPTKNEPELPVFEEEKTEKQRTNNKDKNFTFVNSFKMKPNFNSTDSPVPSDPLPTDFE